LPTSLTMSFGRLIASFTIFSGCVTYCSTFFQKFFNGLPHPASLAVIQYNAKTRVNSKMVLCLVIRLFVALPGKRVNNSSRKVKISKDKLIDRSIPRSDWLTAHGESAAMVKHTTHLYFLLFLCTSSLVLGDWINIKSAEITLNKKIEITVKVEKSKFTSTAASIGYSDLSVSYSRESKRDDNRYAYFLESHQSDAGGTKIVLYAVMNTETGELKTVNSELLSKIASNFGVDGKAIIDGFKPIMG
jgi:hypothetical protein